QHQRHEWPGITEYHLAHQLIRAFTHTYNIEQSTRLERGNRLGADGAAIRNDAHPANRKPLVQPIDHRHQRGDVGGIAGPHLGTNRSSVTVNQHREDHLPQIRSVILAISMPTERLSPLPFEVETCGVKKYQVEAGEQIASMSKQLFLDHVLGTAWWKLAACP